MKKILKWVFLVLLVAALAAGVFLAAYVLEWPKRLVAAISLAVVGGVCAVVGLVRWLRRRRQRRADAEAEGPVAVAGSQRLQALADRWRGFIRQLRKAKIAGGMDPVTALPWYLVLGETAAGKTLAVENSLVVARSPGDADGVGEADGFQWRLLEEGLVLDVPGHYALHRDGEDAREWESFLSHMRRLRRAAPLHGIVVAVSAATLLGGDAGRLKTQAEALGKRLDEVLATLGVVVPVYVLVTQCDRVGGMTRFFEAFPPDAHTQAWGGLNDERDGQRGPAGFLAQVFDDLYGRLCQLRLTLLGDAPAARVNPHVVLFPEEFQRLRAPLEALFAPLFEHTPYRESPFLRGLYFCSARQEGAPLSGFLDGFAMGDELLPQTPGRQSMFLKEFFSTVLGRDRSLVARSSKALGWSRRVQLVALSLWVLTCLVLGGLVSATFVKDLAAIQTVAGEIPPNPYLGQDFGENLAMLDQLRVAITAARERDRDSWLPRFGLNHSTRLLRRLEALYCGRFRQGVLGPLDKELDLTLDRVAVGGEPVAVARHVDFMTRRSVLLQRAVEAEGGAVSWEDQDLPEFGLVLGRLVEGDGAQAAEQVGQGCLAYLSWQTERGLLEEDLAAERARIKAFLARRSIGFSWLADWANLQNSLQEVNAARYWGEAVPMGKGRELLVERAYTPEGWEAIHRFTEEIAGSVAGEEQVQVALERFKVDYRGEYLRQWQQFLEKFPAGFRNWTAAGRQTDLAGRLAGPNSPYAELLSDAPKGLGPAVHLTGEGQGLPAWVALVYDYERLMDPEYQRQLKGGEGVIGKWTSKGGSLLENLKTKLRGATDEVKATKRDRDAYPYLTVYHETLKQAAGQILSPKASFETVTETYLEAGTSAKEPAKPVTRNFWAQTKLRGVLGGGDPKEKVFWALLSGPVKQVWSTLLDQSDEHLQTLWQDEVLAEGKGLAGWELVDALQGKGGKIWAFQEKRVAPFLEKHSRGYRPRVLFSDAPAVSDGFLGTLNRGKLGDKTLDSAYRVVVVAKPTDANPGADPKPHLSTLTLQCASGFQTFFNKGYPVQKTLSWSPAECSDVVLEVSVGDVLLTKRYRGYDAFIQFLSEFRSGRRVFKREEFPEERGILASYNVQTITLNYAFEGEGKVLRLAGYRPDAVPERIIQ